jgi:hypothetical protein
VTRFDSDTSRKKKGDLKEICVNCERDYLAGYCECFDERLLISHRRSVAHLVGIKIRVEE